jgi:hypothetical protein
MEKFLQKQHHPSKEDQILLDSHEARHGEKKTFKRT